MRLHVNMFVVLLVGGLALAGCSQEQEQKKKTVVSGNNQTETDTGDDVTAAPDTSRPDTGGPGDITPGFMNGSWELRLRANDAHKATLNLVHKLGEDSVTGTFTLIDDKETSGQLNVGSWLQETFAINWNIIIDGRSEQFSYNAGKPEDGSEERLMGRYVDRYDGTVLDARLIRIAP
jgi:hypothetical protein